MAIKNNNELFWKLFNIAGGGSESDVTKVLDSIVKSDRSKLDQYFTNAIDQIAFDTEDWQRLREFLIDLYSAERALMTQSRQISDPHYLSNDDLDELFRSFGYSESVRLSNYNNDPLESKVQLFLDLVNLYKIKGTPRSILEVLQYYGIPELDIFEFWLQKESPSKLIFKGDVIVGTSINPSSITLPYELVTDGDPHWMLDHNQILQLDSINKINLPSKTPYFAVQPAVEVGIENSIFVRTVQDQYEYWNTTGNLPTQNAEITVLGVNSSLLELYLLTLYSFHQSYEIGSDISRFACYDGTSETALEIIDEYNTLVTGSDITREVRRINYQRYIELFSRPRSEHFLYGPATPESVLNLINPSIIPSFDSLSGSNTRNLQLLLGDLAIWVRNNIGFGFVNMGYIFFGLNQLFEDLKPVINFFKPYRARLLVLELIKFDNILTEGIPVEDDIGTTDISQDIYDYFPSRPSCTVSPDSTSFVCLDSTSINVDEVYDCGSYYDGSGIGSSAVNDPCPIYIEIDQNLCDTFRCPPGCPVDSTSSFTCDRLSGITRDTLISDFSGIAVPDTSYCSMLAALTDESYSYTSDTTAVVTCSDIPIVFSEVLVDTFDKIEDLTLGSESVTILFSTPLDNNLYVVNVNLFNEYDGSEASMYGIVVSEKSPYGFTVTFSSPLDSVNYKLAWNVNTSSTISGIDSLIENETTHRVNFGTIVDSTSYSIATAISNQVDDPPSIYSFIITNKDDSGFDISLSSPIDSTNYSFEWNVFDSSATIVNGSVNIPNGSEYLEVDIPEQENDMYNLAISIVNTIDATPSIYSYIITQKNQDNFSIRFSSPIDTGNYKLSWALVYRSEQIYTYRQESGFRHFDTMGRFDCTHGFDMVEITMDEFSQSGVIVQENTYWILQEEGIGGFLLE